MKWENAYKRVLEISKGYRALIGVPNAVPWFGIMYLMSLLKRYESGERTEDLYTEMMECE